MNDESGPGFTWQMGIWDRMVDVYQSEIDRRFVPVTEFLLSRVEIEAGQQVLDLGTGTGAVALMTAPMVAPHGSVIGVDISPEMIAVAQSRAKALAPAPVEFRLGRAESIPAADSSFDVVLASLSMMYVIDRVAAAGEIARVLAPGGRFVAAVWSGPGENDIVGFQETAARFAPPPPVAGVGPGSMADPRPFLTALRSAGLQVRCDREIPEFEFENFEAAWDALAGVTARALEPVVLEQAKSAVRQTMWPEPRRPLRFRNATHYIAADKPITCRP